MEGFQLHSDFKFSPIPVDFIRKQLDTLTSKSNFDPKLLRIAADSVAYYLSLLINQSISSGIVLEEWKKARVTPLYKWMGFKKDPNS